MSSSLEQRMIQRDRGQSFRKDLMHGLSGVTQTAPGCPSCSVSLAMTP